MKYSYQFSTTPSTEARIVTKVDFYKLHQKSMWQQKKKFKNALQSNDRVQNTEAAADFKAFQVDVIPPNSKFQSSLFKSSSRRQMTQNCSWSPVLIVHLPPLCGLTVNMFLVTLPGSLTDRAGNTGR